MDRVQLPIGISDFEEIRSRGYYYVDKSGLIQELLRTEGTKVMLFTRPRRFGKTLGMHMLASFFDVRKNSKELFQGLEITKNIELCKKWMNQYPVLFLSFKDVDGLEFSGGYGMLFMAVANLFKEHLYLLDSVRIDDFSKKSFLKIVEGSATVSDIKGSLFLLMRMMENHYGKKVILILDEYDVPIAKASSKGYYDEMLDVIRGILSMVLKDNSSLQMAVITGCLRIARESIFTGANNFKVDTISDNRYDEYFGFTHKEIKKFLADIGLESHLQKVKQWYNGYRFGDVDVYCPWDVLNYADKVIVQGITRPENFWAHTSDNAVIGQFLKRTDIDVTEKFEKLLDGGYIKERINENLTYHMLMSSEENFWSLLYMTGYLTRVKPEKIKPEDCLDEKSVALCIPNAEVMEIFRNSSVEWLREKLLENDRHILFETLWEGLDEKLTEMLSDLLFDTISFHDYAESFYHAFVTGLVAGAGYIVESNYENGMGRSDIVIKDRRNRRAVVIEAKVAMSEEGLNKACEEALHQIDEKQYARKIERSGFRNVIAYGIAFYKKSCLVKRK